MKKHDCKTPKRIDADTIDVILNHPIYGEIPFTASRNDSEIYGREIFAEADAEQYGKVKNK